MSSASELFHNRRSRSTRASESELRNDHVPSGWDPNPRRPRRHRAGRRLLRREDSDADPQHIRRLCHRAPQTESEAGQLQHNGAGESGNSNTSARVSASSSGFNRLSLARNDQLPDAVQQARARLLERLRGVSLTRSRQSAITSDLMRDEFLASGDYFMAIDSGDWDIELESVIESSDLDGEGIRASSGKPPGLSLDAVRNLQQEIFKDAEASNTIGASIECCICLERFWEGDELIRLRCEHRFHPHCLGPWVRTCGDCPYCRASI